MNSTNNLISLSLVILSATLIAFGSFARKNIVVLDGIYISMLICFVGASFLMWWIVSISSFTNIVPTTWKPIFIRMILSLFAQVLFFVSLSKGSFLITVLLFNTSPLFVPIIRFIFFKQNVSYFNFICIIVSFLGIYLILGVNGSNVSLYSLCALFSGILNAMSQVVLHNASQKEDAFIMTLWIYTFTALVLLMLLPLNILIYSGAGDLATISIKPIVVWVCVAIILNVSVQVYRVKAYKYTKDPSLVAPGMYFSVIVAAVLDIVFYGASINFLEVCGILMVCLSSILSVIRKS